MLRYTMLGYGKINVLGETIAELCLTRLHLAMLGFAELRLAPVGSAPLH